MVPIPISTGATCGTRSRPATFRNGSWACSSSTRSSPTNSTSTCSTPPRSFPEELVPVRIVGRMVLDRMVDNFFAETEQVAFCTQNIVPGIDFTNDPLLQGRNFSYLDTQLKRLGGPNFTISADQRAEDARSTTSSRTATWPWSIPRAAPTTSRTPGAVRRRSARGSGHRLQVVSGRRAGRQAARSGRRPSPTTTARPGSSTSARRRSSRPTSPTRSSSS